MSSSSAKSPVSSPVWPLILSESNSGDFSTRAQIQFDAWSRCVSTVKHIRPL